MAEKVPVVQGGQLIEGSRPTTSRVRGQGGMSPLDRVMLNGEPLSTSFVSRDALRAIFSTNTMPKLGAYTVALKRDRESFPESRRAHLVVEV